MKNTAIDFPLAHVSLEKIQACSGWQDKYKMLIDWGKQIPVNLSLREDGYLVPGCDAKVWLFHYRDNQAKHFFCVDSDSHVIKGLAALLLQSINGKTEACVRNFDAQALLEQAGLRNHLSASRANGFNRIRERVLGVMLNE